MRSYVVARRFVFPVVVVAALSMLSCVGGPRQNTVTVSGVGTVRAQPDTIHMTISLRHIAETTREAQQEVTGMVRQALEILHIAGVEERNIGTAFLRFSPEYEWGPIGRNFLGQRAEQIITFSIGDIGTDGERASAIIDQLIGINGMELQGMHFSVGDPSRLRYEARELAYQEAMEKARQFARLSGRRIVRTMHILEEGPMSISPFPVRAREQRTMAFAMDAVAEAAGTALPAGEMEISARISVEFLMR
ncbi:MAG: SIMPL domain-containing protein [Treponema sp.]|nr:SIMPL domain-containing protein [Treponema sp.]